MAKKKKPGPKAPSMRKLVKKVRAVRSDAIKLLAEVRAADRKEAS